MTKHNTVTILSHLIEISEDGEKGFAEVASREVSREKKHFFERRSADCATAVTELQVLVQSLGGTGTFGSHVRGEAPADDDVQGASLVRPDPGVPRHLQDAEGQTEAAYVDALSAELPHQIRSVLLRQHTGMMRNQLQMLGQQVGDGSTPQTVTSVDESPSGVVAIDVAASSIGLPPAC